MDIKKGDGGKCPGCSRGCRAEDVRCKYGKKYFAQMREASACAPCGRKDKMSKWERLVERGGLAWQLLKVSKEAKKSLKRGEVTEEQLFSPLSMQEREALSGLLGRLSRRD